MNNIETNLKEMLKEAHDEIRKLKEELERHQKHNARGAGRKGRITEDDKQRILEMRREGISYGKIASALNLPIGSVFNYSKLYLNDVVNDDYKPVTLDSFVQVDDNDYVDSSLEDQDIIKRFATRNIMSALRSHT